MRLAFPGGDEGSRLILMVLVYVTLGESLKDPELREQCLRLPEVLSELRKLQSRHGDLELLNEIPERDSFLSWSEELRSEIIEAIQAGLLRRFQKRHSNIVEILRRRDLQNPTEVIQNFKWRLRDASSLVVHVIGPGFDEIPHLAQEPRLQFQDIISEDPALHWFWQKLQSTEKAAL